MWDDGCYLCVPGLALIAKVLAKECQMEYVRVAFGAGTLKDDEDPRTMTECAGYVCDGQIISVSAPEDGKCQVMVQLSSANVETAFQCTNVLLYANDADGTEIPYTYCVMESAPEYVRDSSSKVGKIVALSLIVLVGGVTEVKSVIDGSAFATVATVRQLITNRHTSTTYTLSASGWSSTAPYTQNVAISGLSENDELDIGFSMANVTASIETAYKIACGKITRFETANDTLVATCVSSKPEMDIVIMVRGGTSDWLNA